MRPNWDEYFYSLAGVVAQRSTCPRAHVGTVLVRGNRILATGYNGSAPGNLHCTDVGCKMVDGHCTRTIHSEANALTAAQLNGSTRLLEGATAYVFIERGTNQEIKSICDACKNKLTYFGVDKLKVEVV